MERKETVGELKTRLGLYAKIAELEDKMKIVHEILVTMYDEDDSYVINTLVGKIRERTKTKLFFGACDEDYN